MSDAPRPDPDAPLAEVVEKTVAGTKDETTRREAVEQELADDGRSEEGEEVQIADVVPPDSPAAGVVDDDLADPPEPSEPG